MTATTNPTDWLTDHEASTILRQIGGSTVLAVSGGRSHLATEATLILPVAHGYDVRVRLDRGRDLYAVTRTFRRGGKVWVKAAWSGVYAEDLSRVVYGASCYLDDPEGADWVGSERVQ